MPGKCRRWPVLTAFVLYHLATISNHALAQESASFVMNRVSISATASHATSARFDLALTFGQEVLAGSASLCNVGFLQTLGFWSVLGSQDAPIQLQVSHGATDPAEVELQWTGSSDSFTVYRSDLPESVVGPPNVALITPVCAATDAPPVEVEIVYYLVLPTGGP